MKKIRMFICLLVFSLMILPIPVYGKDNGYQVIESLPLIEDKTKSLSVFSSQEYSDDEIRDILEKRLREAYLSGKTSVNISDLNISVDKLEFISCLRYYYPFICHGIKLNSLSYSGNILMSIFISNKLSLEETKEMFDQVDNEINQVLSSVDSNMSDEQKALAIHDYFCYRYEYDTDVYSSVSDDSYCSGGLFLNKKGVCQAYAYGYQYMMNLLDIECYVTNSNEMSHAWNIIKINDFYYHVDCTWDDPIYDSLGRVRHEYFLLSDSAIQDDHYGWNLTNLSCNNTKYDNAYWKEVFSQIVVKGDNVYFVENGYIIKRNLIFEEEKKLFDLGIWPVFNNSNSWWTGTYSGLFLVEDCLYFNTYDRIYSMNLDGTDIKTIYQPDLTDGYIYGIRDFDNRIQYVLKTSPNEKQSEILVVDTLLIKEPLSISLNTVELELDVDTTYQLEANIMPEVETTLTWISSDDGVVKVDNNGLITTIAEGQSTIKVTTSNGKSATCIITVKNKQLLGDVNLDGNIDFLDAIMVLKFDSETIELNSSQLKVSDVNDDGEVNFLDAIQILRYDAELIEDFRI